MKVNFKRLGWIIGSALLGLALFSVSQGEVTRAETVGSTYYVDSSGGSDSHTGTSQKQAYKTLDMINIKELQPGDKVLLKKGSVFNNQALHLKGAGDAAHPILVGTYGEGSRPRINTNGAGTWYENYGHQLPNPGHRWKGQVSSSILLQDVEYIEISGLELTNDRESSPSDGMKYNDKAVIDRTGLAGVAQNKGTLNHIVVNDLYIHDVDGNVYDKHMANGGIYFVSQKPANESVTGVARYNDLQIKNCRVENVNRWGIAAAFTYHFNPFMQAGAISDADIAEFGNTNVLIENNYVADAGGDAITPMFADRPLIQGNVSVRAARQINTTDYLDTFARTAAAIWPWKCKNALFQYNEAYDTQNADRGNGDGQAWDADSADGTVYQYNYSSGNSGGAVMFCLQQAVNSTFRYNISQNDKTGVLNLPKNPDAQIYNNTFYIAPNVPLIRKDMKDGYANLSNNIIYYTGDPVAEAWNPTGEQRIKYDHNLYYNYSTTPGSDKHAIVVSKGQRVLQAPGSAPTIPNQSALTYNFSGQPFLGYRLTADSPAIGAGVKVVPVSPIAANTDFAGEQLGNGINIGAIQNIPNVDQYRIDVKSGVTVEVGHSISASELIANLNQLPTGTEVTWKENIDANSIGKKKGTIRVAFPDGSQKEVEAFVSVLEAKKEPKPNEQNGSKDDVAGTTQNQNQVKEEKIETPSSESTSKENDKLPQTGDSTSFLPVIMGALVVVILGICGFRKKYSDN